MEAQFQKEIHQMQHDMRQMNTKVDKILDVLSGNGLDKSDQGLVGKTRELEDRVEKLEKKLDRAMYWLFGAAFILGATIPDVLIRLFTHK